MKKKHSPFLRALPYVLVAVLLLSAAGVAAWMFLAPSSPAEPPAPSEPADAPKEPGAPLPPPSASGQEGPVEEAVCRCGALAMTMDGTLRADKADVNRVTLHPGEDELPRLDAQALPARKLSAEGDAALAAGLLQAYYADPPAADAIRVTADTGLDRAYFLQTDAVGDTPAMAARVRFLQSGSELWYLILVFPDGDQPADGLTTAYATARLEG